MGNIVSIVSGVGTFNLQPEQLVRNHLIELLYFSFTCSILSLKNLSEPKKIQRQKLSTQVFKMNYENKKEVAESPGMEDLSKIPKQYSTAEEFSRKEQRKVMRKVDIRIIFPLGLMLAASFLDRANIGNAAIAG